MKLLMPGYYLSRKRLWLIDQHTVTLSRQDAPSASIISVVRNHSAGLVRRLVSVIAQRYHKAVIEQLKNAGWKVLNQSTPPGWLDSLKPLLGLIVRNFWRVRLHRVKSL